MKSSKSQDSFTGLKKKQMKNMAYGSTSNYLRQIAWPDKFKSASPDNKPSKGVPVYKTPEEYYDEILELKKQIQTLNAEAATRKSKLRRLEEENAKKDKEIEQFLSPAKGVDVRHSMADGGSDSSAVIHGYKQKILRLEQQLREKENSYSKLQSDLKTTKIEELKLQMEAFYAEVQRLQHLNNNSIEDTTKLTRTKSQKEVPSKMKALQDTVLKMNEKNVRLQNENRTLKEDLQKCMELNADNEPPNGDYSRMSKTQLVHKVTLLQKKVDRLTEEQRQNNRGSASINKTVKKQQAELLDENAKLTDTIKDLKQEKLHYQQLCVDRDMEIKELMQENDELRDRLKEERRSDRVVRSRSSNHTRASPRQTPPPSGRRSSSHSRASPRQATPPSSRRTSRTSLVDKEELEAAEHRSRREDEDEIEQSMELIQSTFRGHQTRKKNLERMKGYVAEDDNSGSGSELEKSAELIQSNIRGYNYRRAQIQKRPTSPAASSSHSGRRESTNRPSTARARSSRSNSSSRRQEAGSSSRRSARSSRALDISDDDIAGDDDDDLLGGSQKYKKLF